MPRSDAELTFISYNVLAEKYVAAGFHPYCDAAFLAWSYRQPRILAELDAYNADVICLQEVEQPAWEDELLPHFRKQGFEGIYYARQVRPTDVVHVPGPPEGCALLTRTQRLNLLDSRVVRTVATSMCWPLFPKCVAPRRFADHVADLGAQDGAFLSDVTAREDGAVVVLAEETSSRRRILLACTHLFWNPHFPDVKAAQASLLMKQIQRFGNEHGLPGARPLLLGGDFNSLWRKYRSDPFDDVPEGTHITSGVYELLSVGRLCASNGDHPLRRRADSYPEAMLDTGIALTSAYLACRGNEPPITNNTASFRGALDYVWFGGADDFSVSSVLELPYAETSPRPEDIELLPMPNEHFPSDHLAVGATLQLLSRT